METVKSTALLGGGFQEGLYRWMTVEEWKDENGAPNDLVAALKVCCCIMTMHHNDLL